MFPYQRWTVSPPVFTHGPADAFDSVAVKDPSIVFHEGAYHLFYTTKTPGESLAGLGYASAPTLSGLNSAIRHNMDAILGEAIIAPQVFYFEPHQRWYLIAHKVAAQRDDLIPVYLTNPEVADPDGWSKPEALDASAPASGFWIDFWVICDDTTAHLFYTDHIDAMFRQYTPINEFPHGFGARPEQIALSAGGDSEAGPWRLHEASHIYRVQETGQYLALIEGVRPHPTRPNYWDSRNRFVFAAVADSLEGPWQRVERHESEFVGDPAHLFDADGRRSLYGQVSHPEVVRAGFDQRLEISSFSMEVLFQAFDASDVPDEYDYDLLPWELAVMTNHESPESAQNAV